MRHAVWATLAVIMALAGTYLFGLTNTDSYWGRWIAWNMSDVGDRLRFPARPVETSSEPLDFSSSSQPLRLERVQYTSHDRSRVGALDETLSANGTFAFIVIRNDEILYERYFNGHTRDSIVTSFSIAKSITSLLVGAAIDAGEIHSLDDPIADYIPELANRDPRYRQLTLRQTLDMRSGISFADHDLPWGDKPRAYYDPHLRNVVLSRGFEAEPGQRFEYNTYNPMLLGLVLERATGRRAAASLQQDLWMPLRMECPASWSIDSVEGDMEKMESGINACPMDFARIGRLMLNGGSVDGVQVISANWIANSMRANPANVVPGMDGYTHYQHGWWVTAAHGDVPFTVAATGHLGQYLMIYPDQNVIIVRFGANQGAIDSWPELFRGIVAALPTSAS